MLGLANKCIDYADHWDLDNGEGAGGVLSLFGAGRGAAIGVYGVGEESGGRVGGGGGDGEPGGVGCFCGVVQEGADGGEGEWGGGEGAS